MSRCITILFVEVVRIVMSRFLVKNLLLCSHDTPKKVKVSFPGHALKCPRAIPRGTSDKTVHPNVSFLKVSFPSPCTVSITISLPNTHFDIALRKCKILNTTLGLSGICIGKTHMKINWLVNLTFTCKPDLCAKLLHVH